MQIDSLEPGEAESESDKIMVMLEGRQKQFDALAAENFQLKRGKSNSTFWLCPMVYSQECWESPQLECLPNSIEIGLYCLCMFPFPQNDIVVSSCRHLYHHFCTSVLFVNFSKCLAKGCGEFPPRLV